MRHIMIAISLVAVWVGLSPAQAYWPDGPTWIGSGYSGFQAPAPPQTPTLGVSANSNPLYSPGLTALQLLDRAMPYLDAADAVYKLQPLNGQSPQDWRTFFPRGLTKLSPDVIRTIDGSGFRAGVYMIGKQPVLAIAGSESPHKMVLPNAGLEARRDWYINFFEHLEPGWKARYFGTQTDFADSQSVQNQLGRAIAAQIRRTHPNLVVVGHSLGGEIAAYAGATNKIPAVTFNPSATHFSASEKVEASYVLNFVIKGEIAQASGKPIGNTITFDPHLSTSPLTQVAAGVRELPASGAVAKLASGGYLHLTPRFREIQRSLATNPAFGFTSLRTGNDGFAEFKVSNNGPLPAAVWQPTAQPPIAGRQPQPSPAATAAVSAPSPAPGGASAAVPKPNVPAPSNKAAAPVPNTAAVPAPKSIAVHTAPAPTQASAQRHAATPAGAAPSPPRASVTGFSSQARMMPAVYRPGGISLSKAAAERMALNVDLEGLHYSNGQIVLSGRPNPGNSIDAALFLTALRTACETGDPYFSLDPENGVAWTEQGRSAVKTTWEKIKGNYTWTPNQPANRGRNATISDGVTVQTLSVRRDLSLLWSQIEHRYPDLRTRLVFRPDWLRETRFGEILYRADVLLKELSSGVSIVDPKTRLRAAAINGYVAPHMRSVIGGIFDPYRDTEFKGHRLWFDLIPQRASQADSAPAALPRLDASRNPALYAHFLKRGHIVTTVPNPVQRTAFYLSDDAIDLSQVYPKMFVRRHDHVTNQDISGTDAYLNLLSWDVNERTERYAAAYKELRELTEVFRAYVASVKIVRQDSDICPSLRAQPLYPTEKTSVSLPAFHPSELFIDVVRHVTRHGNRRRLSLNAGRSISGGIALRGREFYELSAVTMETQVIADLKRELVAPVPSVPQAIWKGSSGRQFVALNLFDGDPATARPGAIASDAPGGFAGALRAAATAAQSSDQSASGRVVGGKFIARSSNRYFRQEGYKSFVGGTYAQCEQLCLNDDACVAVGFKRSVNGCELFSEMQETREDRMSDIGIKQPISTR